jgi:hypothetical protein
LGLYFIRQYALFLSLFLAVIASFIVVMRIIDYSTGGLEESSRNTSKER